MRGISSIFPSPFCKILILKRGVITKSWVFDWVGRPMVAPLVNETVVKEPKQ